MRVQFDVTFLDPTGKRVEGKAIRAANPDLDAITEWAFHISETDHKGRASFDFQANHGALYDVEFLCDGYSFKPPFVTVDVIPPRAEFCVIMTPVIQ